MSTLRFESEYVTGVNYPKALATTPVNVGASLVISRQLRQTLTAGEVTAAVLQRATARRMSAVVGETATVRRTTTRALSAIVNEGGALTKNVSKVLSVPSVQNLVTDPSFEYDTVGGFPTAAWTGNAGGTTAGPGNFQVGTTWAASPGSRAVRLNATMNAGSPGAWNGLVANYSQPVKPSQPYIASAAIWTPGGVMANATFFLLRITWLDAAGVSISTVDRFCQIGLSQGHPTVANGGRFTSDMDGAVPLSPANAVTARVEFYTENWDAGSAHVVDLWVDQVSLTQGSTFPGYGDGDTPGWKWTGTPGNSPSQTGYVYAGLQSGHQYPINLSAGVAEGAQLGAVKTKLISASVSESATLKAASARLLPRVTVNEVATLTKLRALQRVLTANTVSEVATLSKHQVLTRVFTRVINEQVVSLLRVPGRNFTATIVEAAGLNKKGKYHGPPAVLQLYDLVDPYQLPALKGATVAYMHGIFGAGVMFNIYDAYTGLTLHDSFDGAGFPNPPWKIQGTGDPSTVYVSNGILHTIATVNYDATIQIGPFDLRGCTVTVEAVPGEQGTDRYLQIGTSSWSGLERDSTNGQIPDLFVSSGAGGGWLYSTSFTYDPVAHRWWQARISLDGDVAFYASPDGKSWTFLGVGDGQDAKSQTYIFLGVGYYSAAPPANADAQWDNFDLRGPGGAFYVADNGLKQALDQHPALARVF